LSLVIAADQGYEMAVGVQADGMIHADAVRLFGVTRNFAPKLPTDSAVAADPEFDIAVVPVAVAGMVVDRGGQFAVGKLGQVWPEPLVVDGDLELRAWQQLAAVDSLGRERTRAGRGFRPAADQ